MDHSYDYAFEKLYKAVSYAMVSKESAGKRVRYAHMNHTTHISNSNVEDLATWKRIKNFNTKAPKVGPENNEPARKLLRELVFLLVHVQELRCE